MVFLARAQLRFGRLGSLGPGAEGFHGLIAVLVGQQDIPIIIGLPQGLHGLHQSRCLFGLTAPGGGSDTGDFHFADKGLRKGGLALLKQGFGHSSDLFPGERLLDDVQIAVDGHVLSALGGQQQNVQVLRSAGLGVDIHDHNNVFRH